MTKEIEMITQYLDKIGDKIGVGAEKIWPWLVKQQCIDSALAWFWFFGSIIAGMLLYSSWVKADKLGTIDADNPQTGIRIILSILVGIVCIIAGNCWLGSGFKFLNPEYHALMELIIKLK